MKTKMTITVDDHVKKKIQSLAKRMWSNVSVLTNMFYVSAINTWNIHYYDFIDNTWEKLYNEYLESKEEDKKDDFSVCTEEKANFLDTMNKKLWN
jgi:hypothetical protein